MDAAFNKGLEDNPWAGTATPTEVDIMKRKPESPPLEHIPDTMEMFDPWADPARAQLPDFSLSRAEQQIPINNNLEEELHNEEPNVVELADFPTGVFYIRSVLSHKVRFIELFNLRFQSKNHQKFMQLCNDMKGARCPRGVEESRHPSSLVD
jgi:hypothetical protein